MRDGRLIDTLPQATPAEQVAAALGRTSDGVSRVSVPVGEVDPFTWLDAQPFWPKLIWAGRDDDEVIAACGAAAGYADAAEAGATAEKLGAQVFGGLRFDPGAPVGAHWATLAGGGFLLPRFVLHVQPEGTHLVGHCAPGEPPRRLAADARRLVWPEAYADAALPMPIARHDSPDAAGWQERVEAALQAIGQGELQKIVLARRADFRFSAPPGALPLLARLRQATPGCYTFLLSPAPGVAFLGASPERLYRRSGRTVHSEAVAGTRPRGQSAGDDRRLRDELLLSEKDRREHEYVRMAIREALGGVCVSVGADLNPSELRLARGRHLYAGVWGTLRHGISDADLLAALHPTPAVGGTPTAAALTALRTLEPFDRGLYAGPLGWIGPEGAEFCVAIRSGLLAGDTLSLFSGAGIVAGSEPQAEWNEIEQKIGDFMGILGLDGRDRDV